MATYLLYAWPDGPQSIYVVPDGETVEAVLERWSLLPDKAAVVDPEVHGAESIFYPSAFTITADDPVNSLTFDLESAKAYAIERIKMAHAKTIGSAEVLQNQTMDTLLSQSFLAAEAQDPAAQAVIADIADRVTILNEAISNINGATDLATVYSIQQTHDIQEVFN